MSQITILHLSDLHYNPANSTDSKIVIRALATRLSENRLDSALTPDVIFFTGDLVQGGTDPNGFAEVHQEFILPILRATELPIERLYIVPGNHDIDREIVRTEPWIENGLHNTLNSVGEINNFMDSVNADPARGEKPLQRLTNWFRYEQAQYAQSPISHSPFLKTYCIVIKGVTLGISCFNTAWRATGEGDRHEHGNLSIGERAVDRAIADLTNAEIRVALHHHPLDWLLADEQRVLASRLYSAFDVLFHGHLHVSQPEFRQNMFGKAIISECGCVYENRRYFNGFQYAIVDTAEETVTFEVFTYFDAKRAFDRAANLPKDGKITFGYSERAVHSRMRSVASIMERARPSIRASASHHIALDQTEDDPHDIKEFFVCPPLSNDPSYIAGLKAEVHSELDDILDRPGNVVFVGTRECGKTTLAHYIAVRTTEGATDRPRIPVILDFAQIPLPQRRSALGRDLLRRAFTQYLNDLADDVSFQERLGAGDFVFIADNVRWVDDERKALFSTLREAGGGNRWIVLTEASSTTLMHGRKYFAGIFPDYDIVFVNPLPRRSIRELARRWCAPTQLDDREAFSRVMAQIVAADLPRNAYIVSLLLWALVQRRELERINEAALLQNLIEFILDKADFRGVLRREFDFRSKEILLQEIALHAKDNGGALGVNELTVFVINFFEQRGLDFDANVIVKELISSGMLIVDGGRVAFRYRCFQDYFVATKIKENDAELERILTGPELLLYARELDLLTGLGRTHSRVVTLLYEKVTELKPQWLKDINLADFDRVKLRAPATGLQARVTQMRTTPLSSDEIDDFVEHTERRFREEVTDPSLELLRCLRWKRPIRAKLHRRRFSFKCWGYSAK